MIPFDEALALLCEHAHPLGAEDRGIDDAAGRVLAEDLTAPYDCPRSDVSAMDGYAVRDGDLGALPVALRVAGRAFAGEPHAGPFGRGECVRIFTGAPMPVGADRVVPQEDVALRGDIAILEALPQRLHVRARGSDFRAGRTLLSAGRLLDARAIVAAAAADFASLSVRVKPRIAIVATGNELVAPGTANSRASVIPDSLSPGVAALVAEWGGEVVLRLRAGDDEPTLAAAASEALSAADLVVTIGGASVGDRDHARAMFAAASPRILFSKVAMRPGKPVWCATAAGRTILGLPGNPTAAMVAARLLLAPLVAGLAGRDPLAAHRWRRLPLSSPIEGGRAFETFMRARELEGAAIPLAEQESSAQAAIADADLIIRRAPDAPALRSGQTVEVLTF